MFKRTKRTNLLQLFFRIFDPLGLISSISALMKIVFQTTSVKERQLNIFMDEVGILRTKGSPEKSHHASITSSRSVPDCLKCSQESYTWWCKQYNGVHLGNILDSKVTTTNTISSAQVCHLPTDRREIVISSIASIPSTNG